MLLRMRNQQVQNIFLSGQTQLITADITDVADVEKKLSGMTFDVVADFIAFTQDQVELDVRSETSATDA